MNIQSAKNPRWANPQKSAIDLLVKFEGIDQELAYTASQNDVEAVSITLYQKAIKGEYGEVGEYVSPIPDDLKYQFDRMVAYPSIADQLDTLYHEGIEGWRKTIEAVKKRYPKP